MSPRLRQRIPLLATAGIFLALFIGAGLLYKGFFSSRVSVNLLADNAALGIVATGMTLVIFTGGIDLSVGAVVGFTSIFTATLISHGVHPALAAGAALALGAALGAGMGALIHVFRLPAFLITLAGMFLARGGAFWISTESTGIDHPIWNALSGYELALGPVALPTTAITVLGALAVGYVLAHHTRFGRNLLAVGGNENSALLMGLPVGATKITAYTINSTLAALAGLVATIYTGSGNPSTGGGLELDAIAVVVIGGTLLAGGRGHMVGTLLGLLVFGTIQTAILFDGRLSSWWIRIVVGLLLLAFILLQRVLLRGAGKRA
jgi:galactofuranose transport system permease protein